MLAREGVLSPILLPDSRLFKNQVSSTKACVAAQSRAVFVHACRARAFSA